MLYKWTQWTSLAVVFPTKELASRRLPWNAFQYRYLNSQTWPEFHANSALSPSPVVVDLFWMEKFLTLVQHKENVSTRDVIVGIKDIPGGLSASRSSYPVQCHLQMARRPPRCTTQKISFQVWDPDIWDWKWGICSVKWCREHPSVNGIMKPAWVRRPSMAPSLWLGADGLPRSGFRQLKWPLHLERVRAHDKINTEAPVPTIACWPDQFVKMVLARSSECHTYEFAENYQSSGTFVVIRPNLSPHSKLWLVLSTLVDRA